MTWKRAWLVPELSSSGTFALPAAAGASILAALVLAIHTVEEVSKAICVRVACGGHLGSIVTRFLTHEARIAGAHDALGAAGRAMGRAQDRGRPLGDSMIS